MSVSGIGSGSVSSLFQQRRQDLKQIISAVQAGDIAGAQRMLTAYQQSTAPGAGFATAPTGPRPVSPLKQDLSALVDSIQSGDAASARTALAAFAPGTSARKATPGSAGATRSGFDSDLDALLHSVQSKAGTAVAPSGTGDDNGFDRQTAGLEPAWTGPGRTTPDDLFARVLAAYQNSGSSGA